MPASSELVFITGATGHVGFKVLQDVLQAGYRARLAVRSEAKEQTILSNPTFKALNAADRVEFVIVPDLTVPGAYDEAVKGVDYAIHIASPLMGGHKTDEDYKEHLIKPAVQGTVGILESAAKYAPGIKRIVITSSVVAIKDFQGLIGNDNGAIAGPDTRVPDDNGPYYNEFHAYGSSKIAALNATDRWVEANKPSFDIVNIHPSFVFGRDDLVQDAKAAVSGTNAVIIGIANSQVSPEPLPGASVHLDDVAKAHAESLNIAKIPAGSYLVHWSPTGTTDGTRFEDVNAIVEKLYPEQVKAGHLKPGPQQASFLTRFDSTKTEEVFGWKFQDLESQVKSILDHFVELSAAA